jgi:hypothetical protein
MHPSGAFVSQQSHIIYIYVCMYVCMYAYLHVAGICLRAEPFLRDKLFENAEAMRGNIAIMGRGKVCVYVCMYLCVCLCICYLNSFGGLYTAYFFIYTYACIYIYIYMFL